MKTSTMTMIGVGAGAVVVLGWFMGRNALARSCDAIASLPGEAGTGLSAACSAQIDKVPFVTVVKIGIISIYREPTAADLSFDAAKYL